MQPSISFVRRGKLGLSGLASNKSNHFFFPMFYIETTVLRLTSARMKFVLLVGVLVQILLVHSLTIPEYLPQRCRKSDPKYSTCLRNAFEAARPYLVKGVPELKLPALDPLEVPYTVVNRTLNELVSINAILKDVKILGLADAVIEKVKADPKTMSGELTITVPLFQMSCEYDVAGQLLVVPLRSKGFFKGNFTNTIMAVKANMKLVERDGEQYFEIDKIAFKSRIEDGVIKLVSKNPQLQFAADLITNFHNENTRLVLDAIHPIYIQYSEEFFKSEFNKGLSNIPAKELLPE